MYKEDCYRTTAPSRFLKSVKKQESYEEKECRNCCHQLLKKSLITGFVRTAKSKRFLRKAIKLLVFCICTAGFNYQVWDFLQVYLAYPVTQDVSVEYPEEFMAPAVTLCNDNRLFRQRLCKAYPLECDFENTTHEELCKTYTWHCPNHLKNPNKEKYFNFASPSFDGYHRKHHGLEYLNAAGPQTVKDLMHSCGFTNNGLTVSSCNSVTIQATKRGFPYRCFSFFSLLGDPKTESLNLTLNDEYKFILEMHPEEYLNSKDVVQAFVVIHDPRKVVNPFTEGVALAAGKSFRLYPNVEKRVSLPPPYATKCTDYLKEWKENGGYGPLSQKDCIDVCLIESSSCVSQEITYPNNYEICEYDVIIPEPQMMRECNSICQDACEENIYSFSLETLINSSPTEMCEPDDEFCIKQFIKIEVKFSRMRVQKFQYAPKFESIELFSYIGGYLGMWLGISLASLFDIAEMIYDVIYPLLKKKTSKRKQKKAKPIEKSRHQIV